MTVHLARFVGARGGGWGLGVHRRVGAMCEDAGTMRKFLKKYKHVLPLLPLHVITLRANDGSRLSPTH
jgi:hypothetical protein